MGKASALLSSPSLAAVALLAAACQPATDDAVSATQITETPMTNPVVHFEIPVTDMDRALAFYEEVFELELDRRETDGYDMAFFPRAEGQYGVSGALAQGDVYRPAKTGVILYFDVTDIDAVIARAASRGSKVLYPKKNIGEAGFVAEIEDSEGNRIALSQAPA